MCPRDATLRFDFVAARPHVVILGKEPFDRIAQEGKNDRVLELIP